MKIQKKYFTLIDHKITFALEARLNEDLIEVTLGADGKVLAKENFINSSDQASIDKLDENFYVWLNDELNFQERVRHFVEEVFNKEVESED